MDEMDIAPRLLSIIISEEMADPLNEYLIKKGYKTVSFKGHGTAKQTWLHVLGIGEKGKSIVWMFVKKEDVEEVFEILKSRFKAGQKNGPVAFTIKLTGVGGKHTLDALFGKAED